MSNNPSGTLTQNGLFAKSVEDAKRGTREFEKVKVYEKILPGVWSMKGMFELVDYKIVNDSNRKVFRFILKLAKIQEIEGAKDSLDLPHTRLMPSEVKKEVWKRDGGACVLCGSTKNLHFDHDLPFSKGGTSLSAGNVRLLCQRHNLEKLSKIE